MRKHGKQSKSKVLEEQCYVSIAAKSTRNVEKQSI
jgi:hypothetical protein